MEQITGMKTYDTLPISRLTAPELEGETVKTEGAVHRVRNMGEIVFVVLRQAEGLLQTVFDKKTFEEAGDVREGCTIRVEGVLRREERAPHGVEIAVTAAEILLMLKNYAVNGVESPGIFGGGLEQAVKSYQRAGGLSVDGIAGPATFLSLIA